MKTFFNKSKVEYIDAYFYFKEMLKHKLNKMYYYEEIIDKIKNDDYLNKHYILIKVNQYQGNFLINKIIINIKFILRTTHISIGISYNNKETFIHFKKNEKTIITCITNSLRTSPRKISSSTNSKTNGCPYKKMIQSKTTL